MALNNSIYGNPLEVANSIVDKSNARIAAFEEAKNSLRNINFSNKKEISDYYNTAIRTLQNTKKEAEKVINHFNSIDNTKDAQKRNHGKFYYSRKLAQNGTLDRLNYTEKSIPTNNSDILQYNNMVMNDARRQMAANNAYANLSPKKSSEKKKVTFSNENSTESNNNIVETYNSKTYDRTPILSHSESTKRLHKEATRKAKKRFKNNEAIEVYWNKLKDTYQQYIKHDIDYQNTKDPKSAELRDKALKKYNSYVENLPKKIDKAYLNSQMNVALQNEGFNPQKAEAKETKQVTQATHREYNEHFKNLFGSAENNHKNEQGSSQNTFTNHKPASLNNHYSSEGTKQKKLIRPHEMNLNQTLPRPNRTSSLHRT
ncbi:MAG: hypothetical protein IJS76_02730 [Pseudobutyrivibrio sp.]|nr:hypothetical protein [Pseudobutyrivibrio sp.]